MSNTKALALRAESVSVCIICEDVQEYAKPLSEVFGIHIPPCGECGESAVYTVAEILQDPDYYGYQMADVLADLGF